MQIVTKTSKWRQSFGEHSASIPLWWTCWSSFITQSARKTKKKILLCTGIIYFISSIFRYTINALAALPTKPLIVNWVSWLSLKCLVKSESRLFAAVRSRLCFVRFHCFLSNLSLRLRLDRNREQRRSLLMIASCTNLWRTTSCQKHLVLMALWWESSTFRLFCKCS